MTGFPPRVVCMTSVEAVMECDGETYLDESGLQAAQMQKDVRCVIRCVSKAFRIWLVERVWEREGRD